MNDRIHLFVASASSGTWSVRPDREGRQWLTDGWNGWNIDRVPVTIADMAREAIHGRTDGTHGWWLDVTEEWSTEFDHIIRGVTVRDEIDKPTAARLHAMTRRGGETVIPTPYSVLSITPECAVWWRGGDRPGLVNAGVTLDLLGYGWTFEQSGDLEHIRVIDDDDVIGLLMPLRVDVLDMEILDPLRPARAATTPIRKGPL